MRDHRPNILWLLADHYPTAQWARWGAQTGLPRATYDRLAREGATFADAYAVGPLCTPARASMLTGLLPHNHGLLSNGDVRPTLTELRDDTPTFARALTRAGYRCGYFGKWHAGMQRVAKDHGFEGLSLTGYGYPYHTAEYRDYLAELRLPPPAVEVEWTRTPDQRLTGRMIATEEPNAGRRMNTSGRLDAPKETHEAYFLAHLATRWLESVAATGEPFALRVDAWGPHHPYFPAAPFADRVAPESLAEHPTFADALAHRPQHHRDYAALCRAHFPDATWASHRRILARCLEHCALVEDALAGVLAALDRLGLADDTLVVYTADHGDLLGTNCAGFDKGWLMVEETMRIPLALRWPGRVPPSRAIASLASNLDVVPTILEAAGVAPDVAPDGVSLLACARGAQAHAREELVAESHGHYGRRVVQRLIRRGAHKYVAHLDDRHELYDLAADPHERRNLIDEPAYAATRADLRRRLLRAMESTRDDAPDVLRLRASLADTAAAAR